MLKKWDKRRLNDKLKLRGGNPNNLFNDLSLKVSSKKKGLIPDLLKKKS